MSIDWVNEPGAQGLDARKKAEKIVESWKRRWPGMIAVADESWLIDDLAAAFEKHEHDAGIDEELW